MEALKLVKREEKVSLTAFQQRIIDGYKVISNNEMRILRQKEDDLKMDCHERRNQLKIGRGAKYVWLGIILSTHNS
jgi:hypothetical protein